MIFETDHPLTCNKRQKQLRVEHPLVLLPTK